MKQTILRSIAAISLLLGGALLNSCGDALDYSSNGGTAGTNGNGGGSGSGISDKQINSLIQSNVAVQASYSDYAWHFRIESSLHKELPEYTLQFGIGHGDVNGIIHVTIENDTYKYSETTSGNKKIMEFENPFWYYYGSGRGSENPDWEETFTMCQLYYKSYVALIAKGINNLSASEKDLYREVCLYLTAAERAADTDYSPSVYLYIAELEKFFLIGEYRR